MKCLGSIRLATGRRWVFTALATISLLLWVIAVVLWLRGFSRSDTFVVGHWARDGDSATDHCVYFDSDCTGFWVTLRWQENQMTAAERAQWDQEPHAALQFGHGRNPARPFALWSSQWGRLPWERIGFKYFLNVQDYYDVRCRDRTVVVPFWFMLLLLAGLPISWAISFKRERAKRQRISRDQCVNCGYDLRATPECCPECGTIPSRSIEA